MRSAPRSQNDESKNFAYEQNFGYDELPRPNIANLTFDKVPLFS